MSMMFPFHRRSITRVAEGGGGGFLPTEQGRGLINFDRWLDACPDGFHLKIAVSYTCPIATASVLLQFVNPTPDPEAIDPLTGLTTDRRIILEDNSGLVTSFVEDNLGTWWPIPQRSRPDLPYELWFTADPVGDGRPQVLMVDIAMFPNWPSMEIHRNLRRWAECGDIGPRQDWTLPGHTIDPTTGK